MFDAVRQWWAEERAKGTLRLFALGFAVVATGVFTAQGLIGWISHRNALAAVATAKDKADRDVAFHYAVAIGWKRAIPCLDQRMTELMQKLGSAQPIDPGLLARPAMEGGAMPLPNEQQRALLAERYGVDRAQDYWAASQNVTKLSNAVTEIIKDWSGFAMVDSSNGPVNDYDRYEARLAASGVKAQLRALDIAASNVIGRASAIGVEPDTLGEFRIIERCDDVWHSGMTHPNRDPSQDQR
jgi:hypothetical protein